LVEGDAEFILMEALYKRTVNKELLSSGIGVIAVDGKCFKRYLEIAKVLQNRVAVITDNDKNYVENVTNNYSDYTQNQYPNIRIFSDTEDARYTFEVCLYDDNQVACDADFQIPGRRLQTLDYMLKNKADAAYLLLKNRADILVVPQYIKNAITWIDA
jgi:predicted ATP-dependent endonuclease of OLD family